MSKLSLSERLRMSATIKESAILSESEYFNSKEFVATPVPILNMALSGDFDGGLSPGVTTIAGPSKHFKSNIGLLLAKSYLDHYPDSSMLYYDSEKGITKKYFQSFGIPIDRIDHNPVQTIETLTHDLSNRLETIEKGDKVFIFLDSIGNLASRKEIKDAMEGNDKADMTRAKALKAFFRIVAGKINIKELTFVGINHTYKEQSMFPKDIVSGGTGAIYNSDTVIIVGRQAEKVDKILNGYNFSLNIEKSRFVREKSRFDLHVSFKGGINQYSGLIDLAVDGGFVRKFKSKTTMYQIDGDKESYSLEDTYTKEFWDRVFANTDFKAFVKNKFSLSATPMIGNYNETSDDTD